MKDLSNRIWTDRGGKILKMREINEQHLFDTIIWFLKKYKKDDKQWAELFMQLEEECVWRGWSVIPTEYTDDGMWIFKYGAMKNERQTCEED